MIVTFALHHVKGTDAIGASDGVATDLGQA
jgi:hypothetical protein